MKLKRIFLSARAALILFLLFAGQFSPVHGQPATIAAPPPVSFTIPLGRLTGSNSLRLEGLTSTVEVEIPTNPGWQLTDDAVFVVRATYSSNLDLQASTLTFSVNNTPLAALRLSDLKTEGTPIVLPKIRFSTGQNHLVAVARLFLKNDASTNCSNWADPTRWVEIAADSIIQLNLRQLQKTYTLREFPAPFQSPTFRADDFRLIRTMFVLPDGPKAGETTAEGLRSLAVAAFALGQSQPKLTSWDLTVRTRSEVNAQTAQEDNLFFLGESHQGLLQIPAIPHQDSLAITVSPFNPLRAALVVHDGAPTDNSHPELALADPERLTEFDGAFAVLAPSSVRRTSEAGLPTLLTLEDLGYNPRTVNVLGMQNLIYRFYLPYPVQIDAADLKLDFSHAAEAVPGGSKATVYFNGSTIATIMLTDRHASINTLEMSIPSRFFQPGLNYLRIAVVLRPASATCATKSDSIWMTVMNTTSLSFTSHEGAPLPALDDFPQPFNDLEGAILILPDQPDSATLDRAVRLAALFGQSAQRDAEPPDLITASAFDPILHGRRHLVFLGALAQNAALRKFNNLLPQPFLADSTHLASGYGLPDTASIGLIEVARSPWQENHRVLAITGTSEADFLRAFDWILDPDPQKPEVINIVPVSTPVPDTPRLTGNVLAVLPGPQPGALEVKPFVVRDAGNLPLIGPILQLVPNPNLYLSLAAIALGTGVLLSISISMAMYGRWKANRPVKHTVPEEPDTK